LIGSKSFTLYEAKKNCVWFQSFVDKLLTNANTSLMVGTSSWKQQFLDATTVEDLDGGIFTEINKTYLITLFRRTTEQKGEDSALYFVPLEAHICVDSTDGLFER
jgi:hypothetical protein